MFVYIISPAEQISAIILFLREVFMRTMEKQRKIRKTLNCQKVSVTRYCIQADSSPSVLSLTKE